MKIKSLHIKPECDGSISVYSDGGYICSTRMFSSRPSDLLRRLVGCEEKAHEILVRYHSSHTYHSWSFGEGTSTVHRYWASKSGCAFCLAWDGTWYGTGSIFAMDFPHSEWGRFLSSQLDILEEMKGLLGNDLFD